MSYSVIKYLILPVCLFLSVAANAGVWIGGVLHEVGYHFHSTHTLFLTYSHTV